MQLNNLKLLNFRNYESLNLNFGNNNIIVGANGMGKTNLVEAIYVLGITRSFRTSNDKVLIKFDKDFLRVEGRLQDGIEHDYKIVISNKGKKVVRDGNSIHKISDYIGNIKIILFNPNDLQIIKSSPSIRRDLLNVSISEIDREYLKVLSSYNKIIKQRNAYLKTMYFNSNRDDNYLNILTDKLVECGTKIYKKRDVYISDINEYISDIYFKIVGLSDLKIKYSSEYKDLDRDSLLEKYEENKEKDMQFGKTLFGIHHDDIEFILNDKNLKDFGSEGQQKNAIIAYKLSEIKLFKKYSGKAPIFILDDLFSELDREKINNILKLLDSEVQTFITTTDILMIDEKLKNKCKIFKCLNGEIEEVNHERIRS